MYRDSLIKKRGENRLSRAVGYFRRDLKIKLSVIRRLKSGRYPITHFEYPISYLILGKYFLMRCFEKILYVNLDSRRLPFIRRSIKNAGALSLPDEGGKIFIFIHQPFIYYLVVAMCETVAPVHSLARAPFFAPRFIQYFENKKAYQRSFYKPVITVKHLQDKLLKGENVFLAADGKLVGHHHIEVKFGRGKIITPRGIYVLSQTTRSRIVPLFLSLSRILPFPKFEVRVGEGFVMDDAPEKQMEKIEAIFAWYYLQLSEQPYMWNRLVSRKYTVISKAR